VLNVSHNRLDATLPINQVDVYIELETRGVTFFDFLRAHHVPRCMARQADVLFAGSEHADLLFGALNQAKCVTELAPRSCRISRVCCCSYIMVKILSAKNSASSGTP
jgi:hypothetical protein